MLVVFAVVLWVFSVDEGAREEEAATRAPSETRIALREMVVLKAWDTGFVVVSRKVVMQVAAVGKSKETRNMWTAMKPDRTMGTIIATKAEGFTREAPAGYMPMPLVLPPKNERARFEARSGEILAAKGADDQVLQTL